MPTIVFLASLAIYLAKEFTTPLLYGIDGPYYYIQVSHLLTEGFLKYSDPPLSFYILAAFSVMLKDVVSGVKVGSAFITLLTVYPIFFLVKYITKSRISAFLSALTFSLSPLLVRMCFDLIKNSMGSIVFDVYWGSLYEFMVKPL